MVKIPNWCSNYLVVSGPTVHVLAFKNYAEGQNHWHKKKELCEDRFIPYPAKYAILDQMAHAWEELSEKYAKSKKKKWSELGPNERGEFINRFGDRPKDGFNQGGYEWCGSHWGTKWGFCDMFNKPESVDFKDKDSEISYSFESAWSPPTPLVYKMGLMFPKLKFVLRYEEPGMAFKGKFVMDKGKVIGDVSENLVSCPLCYNDVIDCEDSIEDIEKHMKSEGDKELEIKKFIEEVKQIRAKTSEVDL